MHICNCFSSEPAYGNRRCLQLSFAIFKGFLDTAGNMWYTHGGEYRPGPATQMPVKAL